jgi:hypothetical protein
MKPDLEQELLKAKAQVYDLSRSRQMIDEGLKNLDAKIRQLEALKKDEAP